MNRVVIIALTVIILLGGAVLYLSQNSTTQQPVATNPSPTQEVMTTPTTQPSPSIQAGSVKEITVEGSNFKFMPTEIRVKKGDTVRVIFKNTGGMHDFVIDELNVKTKVIQGGQEETVEFVADKEGSFEYYCSVGQHRQMGMKGTLIVE